MAEGGEEGGEPGADLLFPPQSVCRAQITVAHFSACGNGWLYVLFNVLCWKPVPTPLMLLAPLLLIRTLVPRTHPHTHAHIF